MNCLKSSTFESSKIKMRILNIFKIMNNEKWDNCMKCMNNYDLIYNEFTNEANTNEIA